MARWFRRDLEDFDVNWEMVEGRVVPDLPIRLDRPWENHRNVENLLPLPMALVEFFVDESRQAEVCRKHWDKIEILIDEIKAEGIREPITLICDNYGKMKMMDGNHRIAALRELEWKGRVPVEFKTNSRRIRSNCRTMAESIECVLRFAAGLPPSYQQANQPSEPSDPPPA